MAIRKVQLLSLLFLVGFSGGFFFGIRIICIFFQATSTTQCVRCRFFQQVLSSCVGSPSLPVNITSTQANCIINNPFCFSGAFGKRKRSVELETQETYLPYVTQLQNENVKDSVTSDDDFQKGYLGTTVNENED
ncbi:uncharacterized protein LOC106465559 [Limulus polyphemus]|uniref:Uncharacterized protein LOC106465559 n=1 Tax=Limulus polyphemus TaxID=6850 RepID=A0ABM1BFZ1_LIMPO|nr:uncharacterized protein LOC106465559 [Limulus polyphemus]